PSNHIGAAGELVVLIGLVKCCAVPGRTKMTQLELAHSRVHWIGLSRDTLGPLTSIDQLKLQPQPQGTTRSDEGVHGHGLATLRAIDQPSRHAGLCRKLACRPSSGEACVPDPNSNTHPHAAQRVDHRFR
ncbi:MAG: hypothetical protein ABI797_00945, partial [Chloroflexota bacterium]